jgi:hypothetical protein
METLIKIQSELKCPKGSFNAFGKYKYRTAEQILEALKPILKANNTLLTLTDEIVSVGAKLFLKATATVKNETGSESVCGFAELGEHKGMSSEQCTGAASSYARKYALNGLFLIDESEADSDNDTISNQKIIQYTPTESQKAEFENLLKSEKITIQQKSLMKDSFNRSQNESKTIAIIARMKELIAGKFD